MTIENIRPKTDRKFLFLAFIWIIFGLIMLSSASAPVGYAQFNDTYYFVKKQIIFGLLPGILLFYFCLKINYIFWQKFCWIFYFLSLLLLVFAFIPGIGMEINGAHSWIYIFGYTFQSAELAKLAVIILMAHLLSEPKRDLNDWKNGLMPVLAIITPTILLIGAQPDIGTMSILVVIIFVILLLANVRKTYLAILGLLCISIFMVLLLVAPYRIQRLTTFLHPELDPKGVGYQTNQAFLAIGSGGIWGLGLGHSRQKFQYLPEVQADSIFAVIAEEIGFLLTTIFVLLITVFGLQGLKLAKKAPDQFSRLLVGGVMIWFMWQSFLNIGAIVGLLPLTGVPLPFVSHGGSSLMVALMAVGIVGSVSRQRI